MSEVLNLPIFALTAVIPNISLVRLKSHPSGCAVVADSYYPAMLMALFAINQEGRKSATLGEISDVLQIDWHYVAKAVFAMVETGFMKEDVADGEYCYSFTSKGYSLAGNMMHMASESGFRFPIVLKIADGDFEPILDKPLNRSGIRSQTFYPFPGVGGEGRKKDGRSYRPVCSEPHP